MQLKHAAPAFIFAALLITNLGTASAVTCGAAYFNNDITWWHNSPLYFSVAGAPANTCGNLWAWRNGNGYNLEAGGWICTDANGNATKGPWNWSGQADDETGYAYIDWGTCTSPVASHIWDVDPPTGAVTSSCPSSFSGTAADDAWGAGFSSSWAICEAEFYNASTGRWWNPSTGTYSSTTPIYVSCTCSGMPSMNITWSCSSKPSSHTPGNSYTWYAWIYDGGQWASPVPSCGFTG